MRIAICDDERLEAAKLQEYVSRWIVRQTMPVELSVTYGAEEFLSKMEQTDFDLVFLDIQLNSVFTGIDLAKIIRKQDSFMTIVFVTNHKQYAIQGIRVNAHDYLSKPVKEDECFQILNHAAEAYRKKQKDVFRFGSGSKAISVSKIDILYFQSEGHYMTLHKGSASYEFRMTIRQLLEMLPNPPFIQCSKSSVVNIYHAECVSKEKIIMSNGATIPVAKPRWNDIRECYFATHMSTDAPGTVYSLEN